MSAQAYTANPGLTGNHNDRHIPLPEALRQLLLQHGGATGRRAMGIAQALSQENEEINRLMSGNSDPPSRGPSSEESHDSDQSGAVNRVPRSGSGDQPALPPSTDEYPLTDSSGWWDMPDENNRTGIPIPGQDQETLDDQEASDDWENQISSQNSPQVCCGAPDLEGIPPSQNFRREESQPDDDGGDDDNSEDDNNNNNSDSDDEPELSQLQQPEVRPVLPGLQTGFEDALLASRRQRNRRGTPAGVPRGNGFVAQQFRNLAGRRFHDLTDSEIRQQEWREYQASLAQELRQARQDLGNAYMQQWQASRRVLEAQRRVDRAMAGMTRAQDGAPQPDVWNDERVFA